MSERVRTENLCLASPSANPISYITDSRRGLSIKHRVRPERQRVLELASRVGKIVDVDLSTTLALLLDRPVDVLDLTWRQKTALYSIGIQTIGQALTSTEADFRKASYIGPVRPRKMMNVVTAAVLEFCPAEGTATVSVIGDDQHQGHVVSPRTRQ